MAPLALASQASTHTCGTIGLPQNRRCSNSELCAVSGNKSPFGMGHPPEYNHAPRSELGMSPEAFCEFVEKLTGSPLKGGTARDTAFLVQALSDDSRLLSCAQFNELLLLMNKDRV